MKTQSAFTLIELMVTIAIAGILLAIAVPSFSELVSNNRLSARSNEMVSAIAFARSEAMKRGRPVTLCRSANSGSGVETGWSCATGSGGWETGWVVFEDTNNNGVADAGEPRLRGKGGFGSTTYTMRGSGNLANRITFTDQGMSPGFNGALTVCDTHRGVAKQVDITVTGRSHVPSDPGTCS